ncbi:serine/threonine protein kinase [Candidatus Synechococcus calcipolaris G9]|uniref:Serine/threonine protein kinase n=1 Tax=Candidatus Synechococcus calcipolaris G9 TaxID=1497997 RepID=A0ABT6F249_9SYNE|nr:serine/threonine-protein kinase [Candidatus Synechococcus calcipolaris]MDG2991907.1 serine/threonine protein kinase [Candidatus Synechococcus calcipolaris G9]
MHDSHNDTNVGQTLMNRYRLAELIGKGSMGRVYRAEDVLLGGVPVAVKFLAQALMNERMKVRFAQEARAGALLGQKSIHVVRVIDYGVNPEDVPFYVMEYLQGENLSDLLLEEPLPLARFLRLARHMCLGLQVAHEGIMIEGQNCPIIHRDIKPSNVLVVTDPALGELGKVLDFGIAKFLSDRPDDNQTSSFMGTLAYCSPEQIEGRDLDHRSDIYSLGITMYELLTGKMPLQAETHSIGSWFKAHHFQQPIPFHVASPGLNLPKELETLVMDCLAKSPVERPQTMADILKALIPIEERYGTGRITQPGIDLPPLDSDTDEPPQPQVALQSVEEACWQATWPKDKPLAEIVFPQAIHAQRESSASVWVMLPRNEIDRRMLNTRYNQFLFTMSPHPMILWITTIYDPQQGPRWLPCYLDMKQARNQDLCMLLAATGYYPLLFFSLEDSKHCINVMTITIATFQRQLLRDWVQSSKNLPSSSTAAISRNLLKTEFENYKPKILAKLEHVRGGVLID